MSGPITPKTNSIQLMRLTEGKLITRRCVKKYRTFNMFPLCESIFFFESANHLFQDIFFDTIKMLKEQFI